MQQDKYCPRHPENIITHICGLNQYTFRHLCKQCLEESHLHHHQSLDQEQLLAKFENKITNWKFQRSLEERFKYKNSNIRHFKQVIDKICQQIIQFNKYIKEEMKNQIDTYELYEMEQELLKLKSGHLCDIKYDKLIFGNDLDDINIDFASIKEKFKPISFDIGQANQLLELLITDNHDIQPQKMNEEIFYQNCQKMVEQIEYIQDNYYSIKHSFQNSSLDIDSFITGCFSASNGNGDDNTQQGTEELLTGIVITMYLVCKEMKLDLEVNDLFELLSGSSDPDWVSNVIEQILDYKEQK